MIGASEQAFLYANNICLYGIVDKQSVMEIIRTSFKVGFENRLDDSFEKKIHKKVTEVLCEYQIGRKTGPIVRGLATKAMQSGYELCRNNKVEVPQ